MGLCSLSAYSQTIDGFTVYKKFPEHNIAKAPFVHQFENLIYFPNIKHEEFRILDFNGNERIWNPFSLNLSMSASVALSKLEKYVYVYADNPFDWGDVLYYPYIAGIGGGAFKLTNFKFNNPQMEFVSFEDFFGVPSGVNSFSNINPAAVQYYMFPDENYFTWCYIDTRWNGALKFTDRDKPDSVIAEFEFPKYEANTEGGYDGFQIAKLGPVSDMMYNRYGDLFFEVSHPQNTIVRFNVKTEKFTRSLTSDLPLAYAQLEGATDTNIAIRGNTMVLNAGVNTWSVGIKQSDSVNDVSIYNNILLTYKHDIGFQAIEMQPKDKAKYYIEGRCMVLYFGAINDSTIFFTYKNFDNVAGYNTEIITYNVGTGEYGSICVPVELIGTDDFSITSVKQLNHPDGYDVTGILLNTGHFLFYDPANSITEEIEDRRFQTIGIRQITPNPATSSVNVNIMYYPSGIYSNDLEVGLYNYMGEKIIDLTPLGIYTEHNHTWEATFDIPKRLASRHVFSQCPQRQRKPHQRHSHLLIFIHNPV